ncbi:MAG: hypothetical protein JWR07_3681 [Nevskia sp.]|jgi:hypothetical protein|nr:hypothetical protein [Nevskia sp.]
MGDEFIESREFIRGAAKFHDLMYVISRDKKLVSKDIAHSSLIAIDQNDWGDAVDTNWNSTAIAVAQKPKGKVVLVGEDGEAAAYLEGKSTKEQISPAPVMIRNAREIGGYVYACGMKRQVYKRVAERQWVDISARRAGAKESAGFEAIDGFTEDEIYAAGWAGEIWQYDGKAWTERPSPTNVILTAVCCAGDGTVYIAGRGGVLLKGRHDAWEIIKWEDEVNADLWDLCWYREKLYVATMLALFTLNKNTLVPAVFGKNAPHSFYSLTTAEDVLWSIGQSDVASFDGKKWKKHT